MNVLSRKSLGFTLVELLIVIVVIAIIATITVIGFSSVQNRASDTAVQADINSFVKNVTQYRITNGQNPSMNSTELDVLDFKVAKSAYGTAGNAQPPKFNIGYCTNPDTDQFILYAVSASGNAFIYNSQNGGLKQISPMMGGGFSFCSLVGLSGTNPIWGRRATDSLWFSWVE